MNDAIFKGQWKQLRGEVRQRWNKLESLEGRLQERYGWEKERIRTEIDTWRKERETGV